MTTRSCSGSPLATPRAKLPAASAAAGAGVAAVTGSGDVVGGDADDLVDASSSVVHATATVAAANEVKNVLRSTPTPSGRASE